MSNEQAGSQDVGPAMQEGAKLLTGGSSEFAWEQVPRPRFDEYSEKYKDWYTIKRNQGIIEIALGGEKGKTPNNLNQLFWEVGNDPENRVMILTSQGEYWFGPPEEADQAREILSSIPPGSGMHEGDQRAHYMQRLHILQNLIFDIDIPTIGAINGPGIPGVHSEAALCCDITICTEDTLHWDPHCDFGYAPGDGNGLVYQELLGTKRAAYYLYTSDPIDAQTMLKYGMVNEVVPRERLLPRAWEIAEKINQMPHSSLLMTKAIVKRPWTQRIVRDAGFHLAHEFFGIFNDKAGFGGFVRSIDRTLAIVNERPDAP